MRPDFFNQNGSEKASLPRGLKRRWVKVWLDDFKCLHTGISKEVDCGGGRIPGEDDIEVAGAALSQRGCLWPRQGSSASSGPFLASSDETRCHLSYKTVEEYVSLHKLQLANLVALKAAAESFEAPLQATSSDSSLLGVYRRLKRVISIYKGISEACISYEQDLELDLCFEKREKSWLKPYIDEEFLHERIRADADELGRVTTVGSLISYVSTKLNPK